MFEKANSFYFNPLRYWTDRPEFFASFDPVDAELDLEDSLSERYAFLLGRDLGHHRMDPPTDGQGRVCWPHAEMERGYVHGLEMQSSRGNLYLRKLLGIQVRAFARGGPFSSAITVDYLQSIMVEVCPVSGVPLTQGALTETDWSIDRLNNSLGYVPGNVCVLSTKVNTMKGDVTFEALTAELGTVLLRYGPDGFAAEMSSGLRALEGFRLAALMAAPSAFAESKLARYKPFALAPKAWATLDSVVAGIHIECARTHTEGAAYARRRIHFKRLGSQIWNASNRLVRVIRTELARGTHPADIWFNGEILAQLDELTSAFLVNPPTLEQIDPQVLAEAMLTGLKPLQTYFR